MDLKSIKNKMISILDADSGLETFGLKKIFEGFRDNVNANDYPCIMIELIENEEIKTDLNGDSDLIGTFEIQCAKKVLNKDEQLNEMLDFEKLVKVALSTNFRLDGEAIRLGFDRTVYDNEFWPTRIASVIVQVLYRQSFSTRT